LSVVVDASVLVAALVDCGRAGTWAEEIIAGGDLHSSELVRVESANVLRRLESAGKITTADANAAFEDLIQLDVQLFGFDAFAERVWQLRHTLTSYDAWYVAVAEAIQLPLATLDIRLSNSKGPACEFRLPV
jgi:predicted nucleic acid-binding protein